MKIIGINQEISSTSPNMGERYFELDGIPDRGWQDVFLALHRQSMDMMKRNVRLQNNWVVVQCPFEEMQHQIDSLNEICKKATEEIEAAKVRAEEAELKRQELEQEKRENAIAHFNKLKFNKE
ncbi:hypothetical protein [Kosakonia oryzae]|uniref:Uncharacterized protein n=1 Tax=Kosakonia oryzae TaxID=497725 RepID=A0AA94H4H2_9ENTR|nr:hypothetical protein [Kosakonia oryzae]ANI82402.1 hypothetical protein AWR26_09655 [Kosakonia oryzae]SFC56950.1 hypothetical protein SAMN05216286_2745 [Kosakonia oryzae]